ncbi:MAG: 3-deoxy-D-manno-octulosonic acid transferase [Bacteroidaceae bacterium]|nr:3-deoxy-D-manno-octulosonic acid transferase [Bacteroidaceae bacterium]
MMYTLAIYLYLIGAHLVAIFNKKARLLIGGHHHTFPILERQLQPGRQYAWFHAASLGEFEQGRMLMERLREEHPEIGILLTFFSPSGYEVRKNYEGADIVCYLPFDVPFNARKFVQMVHPCMAFFIKYEFWKNYLTELHREGIPTYSVASIFRPDQIFFRSYAKGYAQVLQCFTHFFVQNEVSRQLLSQVGLTNVTIVGDTRLDRVLQIRRQAQPVPLAESFVQALPQDASVLVAGSTWPADEEILIPYFNQHPEQYLILAPHVVGESHLKEIESKLERPSVRLSQATPESVAQAHCLLIDGYGLLSSIYRYGKQAYVGGGFGVGIHNVPEAAVYGVPVTVGPNNKKFREVQELIQRGAVFEIRSSEDYEELQQRFAEEPEFVERAGHIAAAYIAEEAGAVEKIVACLSGSAGQAKA